jgi:SAM-dependent methyltransferase
MQPEIKIDLSQRLSSNEPVAVELGCGNTKMEGRIGIDRLDTPSVDIVADIELGLPFLPDNSVDAIHSHSFFEHVDRFQNLVREVVRVLKPNGKCHLFVPHFSNPYYYSDFTHKRFFGLYTFHYFAKEEEQLKRTVPSFYSDIRIKNLNQKLVFASPFRGRHLFKKAFGLLVNSSSHSQEFYEENLCYIVPCYGITIDFEPDK